MIEVQRDSGENQEREVRIILFDWRDFLKDATKHLNPYELKMLVYFALETFGAGRVWTKISLQQIKDHTGYSHPTTLKHLKKLKEDKWIKTRKSTWPEGYGFLYTLGDRSLLGLNAIKDDTPTINGVMVTRLPAAR